MKINLARLTVAEHLRGETEKETNELKQLFEDARHYITSFQWCKGIRQAYFGAGVDHVIGLFLFNIVPGHEGVDEWVWVVVGDLPPAYLAGQDAPTAAEALKDYIWSMRQWVDAVKKGESTAKLIPVNVPPLVENASNLERRLRFLEEHILPRIKE